MQSLLHSRKFWLAMLDLAISLVLYFAGKYANPSLFEDIRVLILGLQPVFVAIIAAIAYEDGQEKRAGGVIAAISDE